MKRILAAGAIVLATLGATASAASEQVSLVARPAIVPWGTPVKIDGAIALRREGELVTLEWKECGPHAPYFRQVSEIPTGAGGEWSTENLLRTTTTLRARWRGSTSDEVTIRARPYVLLRRVSARRFDVRVHALQNFWRKRVVVQRFDRRFGMWANVRTVVLRESGGAGGYVSASASFRAAYPKGAVLRAHFPLSQARPCYLAGTSPIVRT